MSEKVTEARSKHVIIDVYQKCCPHGQQTCKDNVLLSKDTHNADEQERQQTCEGTCLNISAPSYKQNATPLLQQIICVGALPGQSCLDQVTSHLGGASSHDIREERNT